MVEPKSEYRELVRELAQSQWSEPVTAVVHLGEVKPEFAVPGRRKDGTFAGKRLVRRFFWNILRGTTGGIASVALSIMGGEIVSVFGRTGKVTGPADAQALALVDAVRPAKAAWLVYSETRIGLVETGPVFYDPADNPKPVFLWQAAAPEAPAHLPRKRRLRWPDGSTFDYGIAT